MFLITRRKLDGTLPSTIESNDGPGLRGRDAEERGKEGENRANLMHRLVQNKPKPRVSPGYSRSHNERNTGIWLTLMLCNAISSLTHNAFARSRYIRLTRCTLLMDASVTYRSNERGVQTLWFLYVSARARQINNSPPYNPI